VDEEGGFDKLWVWAADSDPHAHRPATATTDSHRKRRMYRAFQVLREHALVQRDGSRVSPVGSAGWTGPVTERWRRSSVSVRLTGMAAVGTSSRGQWTRRNTVFTLCSAVTLVAAIEVILFGVIWTHGVYGSRMAWLGGLAAPLLLITAALAWAGARPGPTGDTEATHRDRRIAPRTIGTASLLLVGIPVAFFLLLLLTYGSIVVSHWLT
jgi:hypothetical protein